MKLSAIYFSCGKHVNLLKMSLETLRTFYPIKDIFVISDSNDPVGEIDGVTVLPGQNSDRLLGLDNIRRMISMYNKVMMESGADYLLKIDSDILAANSRPLSVLEAVSPYAYGTNPLVDIYIESMSGGAYWLSKKAVHDLVRTDFPAEVEMWRANDYPEDITVSLTLKERGNLLLEPNAVYNHRGVYLSDSFLTPISMAGPNVVRKFSFIHCRNNEYVMKLIKDKIYDKQ